MARPTSLRSPFPAIRPTQTFGLLLLRQDGISLAKLLPQLALASTSAPTALALRVSQSTGHFPEGLSWSTTGSSLAWAELAVAAVVTIGSRRTQTMAKLVSVAVLRCPLALVFPSTT